MAVLSDSSLTTITGAEFDNKFSGQLIGKSIPIFVGGQARVGFRLIEGPFIRTVDGVGYCDAIFSGVSVAVPEATRSITKVNLNGTESWTLADGFLGTAFSGMTIDATSLPGSETQTPIASSIGYFGANAVPYRSHVCIELKNIPLSVFANLIPFTSPWIYQDENLARSEAIRRLGRVARFAPSELEIDVSGVDDFWIKDGDQTTHIGFLQDLQKSIGRNWNICASDKLRVFENDSTETPIVLTRDDVVADSVKFWQDDPRSIPAVRNLGFVDTEADNAFNKVKAVRARFPIALTASEDTEDLDIPIGMSSIRAKRAVNKSLLIDDFARDKVSFKALPHWRGLRPGDLIAPNFSNATFATGRIVSVARNAADWTIDVVAERIEMSLLVNRPVITSNGGGATASISISENGVIVTTVAADDADETGAYSIIGGDDAALFTIDADTGVLEFNDPPDFEDPQDADVDNVYDVIVQALGDGLADTQAISVTVADVTEASTYVGTYLSEGIY